jgi:hypothetical protein
MKTFMIVVALSGSSAMASGNGVGNGGKVLYCPNSSPHYEMFDSFEARVLFNQKQLSCKGAGYAECLHAILSPLSEKFPTNVADILTAVDRFPAEAIFLTGQTLPDVPDDEHLFLPNGCELRQIAIENSGQANLPPEKKFVVNGDYFKQLSPENQAAAVLHEIFQAERDPGLNQTTPMVRRIISTYLSGEVAEMNEEQFFNFCSRYNSLWSSVRRGGLGWLTQNSNLMSLGHPRLDFSAGILQRVRSNGEGFGRLVHGRVSLQSAWKWENGFPGMDIELTAYSLLFHQPMLLNLASADGRKVLGEFRHVISADQSKICAATFNGLNGNNSSPPVNGCWTWDSLDR